MRTTGDGVTLALALRRPSLSVTDALRELTDGLLLGDAYVERCGRGGRLSLAQTVAHADWVKQVLSLYEKAGMGYHEVQGPEGDVNIRGNTYKRRAHWGFRTLTYDFFMEQRTRWYPNGRKQVPPDVLLTPLSIAHWYFGDGGVGGKGYHATFSTDGFSPEDVDFLIARLSAERGWRPTHDHRNRIVLTFMEDRADLLSIIKDITPPCFQHKLRLKVNFARRKVGPREKTELFQLRKEGWSYGDLARKFNVPRSDIALICKKVGLGGAMSPPGPKARKPERLCTVPGCAKKHCAKGLCAAHYREEWVRRKSE
jgi:hypothetical protein